jgi:PTH1 family peptidyl-tRNA hydrolase
MESQTTTSSSFLIVGLGNPGRQYQSNRHNIGFMLLNRLAERFKTTFSRLESKALVTKTKYHDHPVILAKPQTYMNLSGQSVASLVKFYKIPLDNVMVVYDEVDLPFGRIRIRPSGGSAGHKGIASIIERLGTQDFPRMRLGIGRPPGSKGAASYVLKNFSGEDAEFLPQIIDRAADAIFTYIAEDLETAMNRYNPKADEDTSQDAF